MVVSPNKYVTNLLQKVLFFCFDFLALKLKKSKEWSSYAVTWKARPLTLDKC